MRAGWDWYAPLRTIESKGSAVEVVGGLGGLAAARAQHQGQFWTPDAVVRLMWRVVGLSELDGRGRKLTILDNSFGSGRMFQLASPTAHRLVGIEQDALVAERVITAARAAGFELNLEIGSMDEFRCPRLDLDVGLVNPPFSVHLDTPLVEDLGVNAYGRYGPKSSTLTHRYALAQALRWCRYVVAVVPMSLAAEVPSIHDWARRHVATLHLPRKSFRGEGAEVDVSIVVFSQFHGEPAIEKTLKKLDHAPLLELEHRYDRSTAVIRRSEDESGRPAVTHPVTGDRKVRVAHDGRKVVLGFGCAVTQARVMNHVLQARADLGRGNRNPPRVRFQGQGQLDLECYLAQPQPAVAFEAFLEGIDALGFETDVDPAIWSWIDKRKKRRALEIVPFRHTVQLNDHGFAHWLAGQSSVVGVSREPLCLGWVSGSPFSIEAGARVEFTRRMRRPSDDSNEPSWSYIHRNHYLSMVESKVVERFDFPDFEPQANAWTTVHEGLAAACPERYKAMRARAKTMGLDRWCSWDYQFDDLCEVSLKRGAIVGWDMGLGKARLAVSLCYLGGGARNLISVEANLVKEMVRELRLLEVPESEWQVITKPEHARELRRVNIIAYTKLKAEVSHSADKARGKTYADVLRRRIHTHVADEGHLLRNGKTAQTRAVIKVSAKGRRYLLSGTPIANYPRDILPLLWWVAGDGVCSQVYGQHWPMMRAGNLERVDLAGRGVDEFRDLFVTLEWVTNEFADDLRSGAKREVPKIADVAAFRRLVAPWIKRRVQEEPDVARYIKIPRPLYSTHVVPWDRGHLAYYVNVAREFCDWFKNQPEWKLRGGAGLIAILAKIRAVFDASNFPTRSGIHRYHGGPTSKQRRALELLELWTSEGHKSIVLCDGPTTVRWIVDQLEARGVKAIPFHGELPINRRLDRLDKDFREGDVPVLVASKTTLQLGLNIHQASRVLHYDRAWTPKVEMQANARVLRPQQANQVEIHYLGLPGSIDDYQAQMVAAKASAMCAGLDYGAEEDLPFEHLETLLGRFVEDFETKTGPLFER